MEQQEPQHVCTLPRAGSSGPVASTRRLRGRRPGCLLLRNRLYIDGEVAPRGSTWGTFALPDGRDAKLTSALTRTVPTVVVDGESYVIGKAIPISLVVLQFAPMVLVGLGGCLGGAAGGVGLAANMHINRQDWPVPVKVGAMLVSSGIAVVLWLVIAGGLSLFLA